MKKFKATIKEDEYSKDYIVTAESKEDAVKKIREITGETVRVKEC